MKIKEKFNKMINYVEEHAVGVATVASLIAGTGYAIGRVAYFVSSIKRK